MEKRIMTTLHMANIAIMVIMLSVAFYTDMLWCKIFNKLTMSCMALGIILNTADTGITGMLYSLGGVGLVILLYLCFAPSAGIGGGDAKLMMAVGALMGVKFVVAAMLFTAIIGGVLALVVMARHRIMLTTTRTMFTNLYLRTVLRSPVQIIDGGSGIKFRYSLAIALGSLLALAVKF